MKVTITGPGLTVSTDGPVESADALQRSVFEVRLPSPTGDEAARAGQVLAEWLAEQRARRQSE